MKKFCILLILSVFIDAYKDKDSGIHFIDEIVPDTEPGRECRYILVSHERNEKQI